ncbi:RpiB/LacA/LacB family sugar-phosphate isomerase [candidate division KSB1 bacterium]|nr:RpiB/LacA/LacB family sugar-phosphate isomerase [candidate division KSB1 bacterium]
MDRIELEKLVREITERVLAEIIRKAAPQIIQKTSVMTPAPKASAGQPSAAQLIFARKVLTERDILDTAASGKTSIILKGKPIITPLARERASDKGIALVATGTAPIHSTMSRQSGGGESLALLAKRCSQSERNMVVNAVASAGYSIQEIKPAGITSNAIAEAALDFSKLISDGACSRGIVVDENVFALAVQANKFPNVRAATCWDVASAEKSRSGCDANVLLLNNRLLGLMMLKQITTAWLGK